jgi:hypothetical protein
VPLLTEIADRSPCELHHSYSGRQLLYKRVAEHWQFHQFPGSVQLKLDRQSQSIMMRSDMLIDCCADSAESYFAALACHSEVCAVHDGGKLYPSQLCAEGTMGSSARSWACVARCQGHCWLVDVKLLLTSVCSWLGCIGVLIYSALPPTCPVSRLLCFSTTPGEPSSSSQWQCVHCCFSVYDGTCTPQCSCSSKARKRTRWTCHHPRPLTALGSSRVGKCVDVT